MIDTYTNGAQTVVDKLKQFMASPAGIFLYSSVTGVVGVVILLFFLSMFMAPNGLLLALPAVVGFNAAASAFSIRDKNKESVPHKFTYLATAALITLTGCLTILLFCPWETLFDANRYFQSGVSALIFSGAGAWIAGKAKSLNRS